MGISEEVRLTATTAAALTESRESTAAPRRLGAPLWAAALLLVLTFLVIYPLSMLVFGALSDSNPVVDGFGAFRPSLKHFGEVLVNENVHLAFYNALVACGGGTILAVVIGLAFSWIVVRTNTPAKGFHRRRQHDPVVRAAPRRGRRLGHPRLAQDGPAEHRPEIHRHRLPLRLLFDVRPDRGVRHLLRAYVYMFTSSALRNMDPSLEEASEVSGASAFTTLFTVTFPLIAPAILAGTLLSFVVMLGIYGVPAALGAPANINVLTTYIFKLTAWSPPLYNTAAAVAILLMLVTAVFVWAQQKVLSGKSYAPSPARRSGRARSISARGAWFTLGLALVYLFVVVVLPTFALMVRGLPQVHVHQGCRRAVRHEPVQPGALQCGVRQPRSPCCRSGTR